MIFAQITKTAVMLQLKRLEKIIQMMLLKN